MAMPEEADNVLGGWLMTQLCRLGPNHWVLSLSKGLDGSESSLNSRVITCSATRMVGGTLMALRMRGPFSVSLLDKKEVG